MAEQTMQVIVNGEPRTVPLGITVEGLIALLQLAPEVVAAEVERNLIPRSARAGRTLAPGERVELVTLVGGG